MSEFSSTRQWRGRAKAWLGFAVAMDQSGGRNVPRIFLVDEHANIILTA